MLPFILFILAVVFSAIHFFLKNYQPSLLEIFLSYLIFFNIGIMGILGFYAHIFMADQIAKSIGWPAGNPFQFEVATANLAFGVLGLTAMWLRGLFWVATILGTSIFLIGAFIGHMIQFAHGDTAPYNSGIFVWLGDLILPLLLLSLLIVYLRQRTPYPFIQG